MDVTVRLFASLRQHAGAGTVALQLGDGATVADAIEQLRGGALSGLPEDAPFVAAVAREYVKTDHPLAEGDELALVPPVSGGSGEVRLAEATRGPLRVEGVRKLVSHPATRATPRLCASSPPTRRRPRRSSPSARRARCRASSTRPTSRWRARRSA